MELQCLGHFQNPGNFLYIPLSLYGLDSKPVSWFLSSDLIISLPLPPQPVILIAFEIVNLETLYSKYHPEIGPGKVA